MAQQLTDEEQLQVLKNWWKENGLSLIAIVVIGAGSYFGWQWWNNYQQQTAENAAALYDEMATTLQVSEGSELSDEQRTTALFLIKQLQDDYSNTQYAVNASFYGAKVAVEGNDLDKAATNLNWVIENREDDSVTLAKLRLARVLFAQENYDEALSLVDYQANDRFAPLFTDVKGDILLAKEDKAGAKAAYQQALDNAQQQSNVFRSLLEVKLANLADVELN